MKIFRKQDQITERLKLIITPLELIMNKSGKKIEDIANNKLISIKLGSQTVKTTFKEPLPLNINIVYCKENKKYQTINGIIKIYEIKSNFIEQILTVGSFNTEEIIRIKVFQSIDIIQKDVGLFKLKMKIQIISLGQIHLQNISDNSLYSNINKQNNISLKNQNFSNYSIQLLKICEKQQNESNLNLNKPNKHLIGKQQNLILQKQLKKKMNQIQIMQNKYKRNLQQIQNKIFQKQQKINQLQNRINQFQYSQQLLKQQIKYIKKQNDTLQNVLNQKQNYIQQIRQQLAQISIFYKQIQNNSKNDKCEIEQLREQIFNLNETIQRYRQKYGDLKIVKSRALQNQLKQCLLWIDQHTRQLQINQIFQGQQNTETSQINNVSDILKSIQLQGTSRQQMSIIKQQLAELIKKIDNFLVK